MRIVSVLAHHRYLGETSIMSPVPRQSDWTAGKILGLIVGMVGLVGFGTCSLCGLVMGVSDTTMLTTVLMFAAPGLIVAYLCFLLVRKMMRLARSPEDKAPPSSDP